MSNTTINKEEKQIGFSLEKCMEILSQTEITRTDLNITQEELEEEEQDIYLHCWFCEKQIIRDSEEHDICHITREGELCCEECLSCCDCENCEKEEEPEEEKSWSELKQKLQTLNKDELYDFIHKFILN